MKKIMEEYGVDSDTRAFLIETEGRLKEIVNSAIKEGFKDMKDTLQELFNKDITMLQEQNITFKKWHQDHFDASIKLNQQITDCRIAITKETEEKIAIVQCQVTDLEKRQAHDEGTVDGAGRIEAKAYQKKETWIAILGILSGVLIAVFF